MAAEAPWRATASGLSLTVRLTPRGGRDAVGGVEMLADGRMAVAARVRAVPADNAANAALIALVAATLGVSRSSIAITAGATSRVKVLAVSGDGAALATACARAFRLPGP